MPRKGHELEIEPWAPVNTLTWLKLMAEDMPLLMSLKTRTAGGYDPFTPLALGKGGGIGSNGWVLSGARTSTGKPILANDSHLGIQIPSVYYEVGLHSKKGGGRDGTKPFNARGFSFEKGYLTGVEELGEKLNKWSWGDIHTATFRNQTFGNSGIGIIERIFNRGPVAVSGSFHQLNRCDYSVENAFNTYHISAMRQIIDLSDLSNSLMIHTPGQSGRPGNRHYDDFIEPWRLLEYHPTRWEKDEMEAKAVKKLILKPL